MESTQTESPAFHATEGDELAGYRTVSLLAVFGFLLGVASIFAMVRMFFMAVPLAAVFVCVMALARIRASDGQLFGRRLALLGIGFAAFFAAAAPAFSIVRQYYLIRQAKPLADEFLQFLVQREPHKAAELIKLSNGRQPLDAHLWDYIRNDETARQSLPPFVKQPLVRTLLALGDKAQIRFYQGGAIERQSGGMENIPLIYAVTYELSGLKRTFFISVAVNRIPSRDGRAPFWRIGLFEGPLRRDQMS